MKPGARVTLIKSIASRMEDYEWLDIDLILRQFGFPWSAEWNNDSRRAYIIAHIERQNDEKLLDLQEFLSSGGDEQPGLTDLTGPWKGQRFRLFASHIHTDKKKLSELKIALESYGIDTFIAHEDIKPTKEWQNEIERALDTCDAALAFLTPNFHNSRWVDQEIGYCISRRILVLPLQLGADPYGLMGKYQGLQGSRIELSELARSIFELFIHHNLTSSRMSAGLLGRLEDAENYETANRISYLLESVGSWSPELLRRLDNARKANRQVAEAWKAKQVISKILDENST